MPDLEFERQCRPLSEHQGERWHWIVKEGGHHPVPWKWLNGTWTTVSGFRMGPKKAFGAGYRYVGPAIPPKVTP